MLQYTGGCSAPPCECLRHKQTSIPYPHGSGVFVLPKYVYFNGGGVWSAGRVRVELFFKKHIFYKAKTKAENSMWSFLKINVEFIHRNIFLRVIYLQNMHCIVYNMNRSIFYQPLTKPHKKYANHMDNGKGMERKFGNKT